MKFSKTITVPFLILTVFFSGLGCSSSMKVKSQKYAKLSHQRVFEYEFPEVWKAIESALKKYKITKRDPDEVNSIELKRISERLIETDWINSKSRDKYVEYKVNSLPRKKYLQTRLRYEIEAKKVLGGVQVSVGQSEEIEKLKQDGSFESWDEVSEKELDSSRSNEMLEKIQNALLSN